MGIPLPWTIDIRRREPPASRGGWTPQIHADELVLSVPETEVDPPRQGDIRCRPARIRIALMGFTDRDMGEEALFVQGQGPALRPEAASPRGYQLPDQDRRNRRVPPHVAYGSLFTV